MPDALDALTEIIRQGLPGPEGGVRSALTALFGAGGRYTQRDLGKGAGLIRDAYTLASQGEGDGGVPFAGFTHPDSPPSGPYGGTSLVWFPTPEGSLMTFVVGTRGLSPDEGILTRPGHRRRITALRRLLSSKGVEIWSKPDPAALAEQVPASVVRGSGFSPFPAVFKRYGEYIYCAARVPAERPAAREVVRAFLDLYALERGWEVLSAYRQDRDESVSQFKRELFPTITADTAADLLIKRRFVILQGPPGTGKTRLAQEILRERFSGSGMTVQFHPAVTYEDFIRGLSPDAEAGELRFRVRDGWLLQAAEGARDGPFLLVLDEINRADLGKVLGEAIYLFEADSVGGEATRTVRLPHSASGDAAGGGFSLPDNLYVLGTMNTADRSIANLDLAIRRRFAFVTMYPDRSVVDRLASDLARETFNRLEDVFVEHVPEDALSLMPGHAYFLASTDEQFKLRARYELLPLLEQYLSEGLLGPASSELYAVRDWLQDRLW